MRITVFALVMALVVGAAGSRFGSAVSVAEGDISYARDYPVCAVRWIQSAPTAPLTIFNQYGEGGYLAYTLSSRGTKVFIFGDAALMGDTILGLYDDVQNVHWNWDQILTRTGTNLVVFDTGAPLTDILEHSPRWVSVYRDPRTEVFARAGSVASLGLPPQPYHDAGLGTTCTTLFRTGLKAAGA